MHIDELKEVELGCGNEENSSYTDDVLSNQIVDSDATRILIGAGARMLFYPTLLYNVVRNKLQREFRWWDRVDEFVLLGAVPFSTDVLHLKGIGVRGVITLNESYETLVPTSLYYAHDIDHLVIPTRDYLFAPSMKNICQAVDFIQKNALSGHTTYVHCKAGRGRSTTVVICYLVKHKQMTPDAALDYVRSIRPRVLLATAQWQCVKEYYRLKVKMAEVDRHITNTRNPIFPSVRNLVSFNTDCLVTQELVSFDDGSVVLVSESDLNGYDSKHELNSMGSVSVVYRVRIMGKAALARISCMWLNCCGQKVSGEKLRSLSLNIHVF